MVPSAYHKSYLKVKTCEWCKRDIKNASSFKRWHGDNCYLNPDSPRYGEVPVREKQKKKV